MDKKQKMIEKLQKNLPTPKRNEQLITKKDIKDDYEFSRDTYRDLINTGSRSLDTLAELARESEHPRAFEVLSTSIKNLGDVTDKLMSLQKAKKDLTQDNEKKEITNNNLFVGSTTDLQRMLLDKDNVIDAAKDKE